MRHTLARGGNQVGMSLITAPTPSAALHSEPYIMFSTDKKSLLCIRCFRDMQGWVVGAGREWAGREWSGSY